MSDRVYREHAIKRRVGMHPVRAAALTKAILEADDLHWSCPKCKHKMTGTMEELSQGCVNCLIQ